MTLLLLVSFGVEELPAASGSNISTRLSGNHEDLKIPQSANRAREQIYVVRNGSLQHVSISQVVVGDILSLKTGDRVPADGLFISGSTSLKLDGTDNDLLDLGSSRFQAIFAGAEVVSRECAMIVISARKEYKMEQEQDNWLRFKQQ
ncbi:cation-transporting atpase plant, putative [Ricinus communis]|uniref:Cation-transporting atpase plant, putative n=1 Tax=Ricinus communis TaxID=3988 RepID=B9T472_RICCO|nr:cation-transporting atpase plant, putative [Ricinus communis]